MPKVGILADTTASIPAHLVRELEIELVPYHVIRGQEDLRDMVDIGPEEFAEYLENARTLPTTSCPSPGEYLDGFKRLAQRTGEIVALTMTSKGSGAFDSCVAAVQLLGERMPQVKVEVVDTLQVAMAHGWAVIEAARSAREGTSKAGVVARALDVARKALMIQTADSLRYLHMGGRIGRSQHLVGSLLDIKPLIGMEDGVIVALGVARSRAKAYKRMAELQAQHFGSDTKVRVAFTHCAAIDQLGLLREEVLHRLVTVEVISSPLSPALAVHSGPGTVGVTVVSE